MTKPTHKILIVDDAKSIRMIVHAILADLDADFEFAEDGLQGIEMIEAKQYDLIITDINMPRLSGLELCAKARKEFKFKNLPILVMTNKHDYTTVETVFSAGATDFITKPINEVEITARVNRILEQRTTEKELYIAQSAAQKATRQKSQFMAMVSHELKTPLNAISGFSHLLLRSNKDGNNTSNSADDIAEKEQQMLKILVKASDQMKSMIDQLLEYDQFESHNKKVSVESVPLASIIETFVLLNKPLIDSKVLTIHQQVSKYITINTDKKMLTTLVSNLLSNAVKYNKQAGSITISSAQSSQGIEFTVSDTGIGMSPEQVEKVFEPFTRFEHEIEGHGLGMAITKSIIEVLALDVSINSEKDAGTCITLGFNAA